MAAELDERLERYADLAVRVGANVEEGQIGVHQRAHRARTAHPGAHARLLPRGRTLRRRALRRPARAPRDDRARARRGAGAHARWLKERWQRWATRRDDRHDGRPRARAALRPRRRARRPGAHEGARRDRARPDEGAQRQLDRHRLPERGLGGEGVRRARRRAALGGGGVLRPARRGGSGRRLARAHGAARAARRAAERAALRCPAVSRAGDGPHRRPARQRALAVGAASAPPTGASTCRTCRPRRSSRRRTGAAPTAWSRSSRPLALARRHRRGAAADRRGRAHRPGRCRARRRARAGPDSRATSGAVYFGELALVDGTSRVGQTGITFFDTLFDENATCHIAYGFGIPKAFDGDPATT